MCIIYLAIATEDRLGIIWHLTISGLFHSGMQYSVFSLLTFISGLRWIVFLFF